jgi:fructose-specific component phosphotransferase system IIB-like protein
MIIIVIIKESLTILRKYLVENIATQTEKNQRVKIIEHILKTDIQKYINNYQI